MERVFRFNRQRNALTLQLTLMLIVAAFAFYGYKQSGNVFLLIIVFLAFALIFQYVNRIFFVFVKFSDNGVSYKSLFKNIIIPKEEIGAIYIINRGRKESREIYKPVEKIKNIEKKAYIAITKKNVSENSLNSIRIATDDRIMLEYVPGIEKYLNQLINN